MTPADEGRAGPPARVCTVCGRPVRQPDGNRSGETLCHEHEPLRLAVRAADQRRRRHGTTAPPVAVRPAAAHRLYEAWVAVSLAELPVSRAPNLPTPVQTLLAALAALHHELDPLLEPVGDTLKLRPSGKAPED